MAYARWADDSDVYIYATVYGMLVCFECSLHNDKNYIFKRERYLAHLKEHIAAGNLVPQYAIDDASMVMANPPLF